MRKTWIVGAVGLISAAVIVACADDASAPTDSQLGEGLALGNGKVFSRKAMLEDLAECLMAKQEAFVPKAEALTTVFEQPFSETAHLAAKTAWSEAMLNWQGIEAMAFGPLAVKTHTGGEGIRDLVYSWPTVSPCLVDQAIANRTWDSVRVERLPIQQRGLAALEYLLFSNASENACPADASPNSDGLWASLSPTELAERRWAFAKALATDIQAQANYLVTRWAPASEGGEDFRSEFVNAGAGSRFYQRQQRAFNVVSDALFYIEAGLKDAKIANPSGLRQCDADLCAEKAESAYADQAIPFMHANLEGFKELWLGCSLEGAHSGLGFADYLSAVGHDALATEINGYVRTTEERFDTLSSESFQTALTSELDRVHDIYDSLKLITDLLRTEFVSVLDFELPTSVEGDND